MNNNRSSSSRDWKDKYLAELERQEKTERQHQQLMDLLVRAVVRISLVADGVDQQLDKQLAGLRNMLREGVPSGRDMNTMVNALDGQVKRLDVVKGERAKVLVNAFQSMVVQLKTLHSGKEAKGKLKRLSKNLKNRSARIQEYSALVNEYASVQKHILHDHIQQQPKQSIWNWFSQSSVDTQAQSKQMATDNEDNRTNDSIDNNDDIQYAEPVKQASIEQVHSTAALDLSAETPIEEQAVAVASTQKEPPFARLSKAICSILSELLEQIEPPVTAKQNYNNAQKQIERGLNWYELVPTLEDISIIVISAFDNYQKEFTEFLIQLNQRLGEANQFLVASEQAHGATIAAGRKLNASMREHVSSMQKSVESAVELDQLKSQVSVKLDTILTAMDQFQNTEQHQEEALSEQLNALIEKVKTMENDSVNAEKRIEEQRQRALRDILTQLPNREAYQARLEQEFERWQRYKRSLSLVVCDIDHFKGVNDNYGHLAGDKVLRIVAKSLSMRLRKTDFIARYGGEEFVLLMPETDQEQALNVVEGIRTAIAACPFHFKDKPVSITLSFGVTGFIEQDKPDSAFLRADKALYMAKDKGRNCSVLAPSSTMPEI